MRHRSEHTTKPQLIKAILQRRPPARKGLVDPAPSSGRDDLGPRFSRSGKTDLENSRAPLESLPGQGAAPLRSSDAEGEGSGRAPHRRPVLAGQENSEVAMLRLGRAAASLRALSAERFSGSCQKRPASAGRKKEILLHVHGGADCGIAEILMNRPHAKNSLGKVLVDELYETLDLLRFDENVRVVIIKSKVGGVFCAGADLKERTKMTDAEADHFVQRLRSLMDCIAALPMPTIAAIDGYALGGGLELALACDLRVAASSAKMGLIETTRGLLPGAGGSQRLPRCIGIGRAKELIFTGRQIDGQEASSIGLVNHAVPQNEEGDAAYQKALALAEEIVPRAPIAVKMGKLAINRGIEVDIASGMAIERMCYAQNIPTRDRQEGMASFIEKRPPKFIGK